ncbi:hypothetical protein WJX72_001083 [[Myrmecia] bisecta]|uniref:Uncharacterized protein n=1 Tax=[Myrmecia] bisecta TaxID=41462 RepID=A0AAW1QNZ7_9CHLO
MNYYGAGGNGMMQQQGRGAGGMVPRPQGGFGGQPRPAGFVPQAGGSVPTEGKLFLGGLDVNQTTKESLLEYCSQWGEVADYVLMEGRGFGFVTFKDPASAQTFLEQRDHYIDGKKVEAKAAIPKNSGSAGTLTKKMFVGGTGEVSDEEFRAHFEAFGEIEDCVILRKPDGGSRGFGFVTFKDEMSVEKCLVVSHTLAGKRVELKRAVRKEEMAAGGDGGYGMDGGYGGGGAGGPMRTQKQPDWICPDCKNKNFGWREQCNRCSIPRPASLRGAGMGMGTRAGAGYGGRMGGYDASMGGMGPMGSMGMGSMGMGGMGNMAAMGMGGYGMGAMGGMGGYGMGGMGMGGMAGGMAAGAGMYGNQAGAAAYGGQRAGQIPPLLGAIHVCSMHLRRVLEQ